MSGSRFRDRRERKYGYDFLDEVLVRCPRCDGCAIVTPHPGIAADENAVGAGVQPLHRRLRCTRCGFFKDQKVDSAVMGSPVDPYFQRPLWLRASCCGNTLWAYNLRHLDLLEAYVQAKLRERGELAPGAPTSLVERLPTWLKTAKNRTEILRTIKRLRSTVPAAG
ncbi:TFIIB-type zinc ribbon-containing protein [Streptomyces triticiradicis]|uniref:TFIIB-type zinc ribbon-containing protein n=2 Tax=Streptomyces TaxID=1883 RepID=A0A7J5D8L8_9ACTN|nr:TFIIB-type zinc ribbon-containing protein [Streptomyces triticiradicis]